MKARDKKAAAPTPPTAPPAPTFSAELVSGPPEMSFCGRQWKRGQPQTITAEERRAMLARGAARLGFTLTKENEDV